MSNSGGCTIANTPTWPLGALARDRHRAVVLRTKPLRFWPYGLRSLALCTCGGVCGGLASACPSVFAEKFARYCKHRDEEKANYRIMERRHGSFQRSVRVPDTVDEDKVEASFDNGVLKVSVRKQSANSGRSRLRRRRVNVRRFPGFARRSKCSPSVMASSADLDREGNAK